METFCTGCLCIRDTGAISYHKKTLKTVTAMGGNPDLSLHTRLVALGRPNDVYSQHCNGLKYLGRVPHRTYQYGRYRSWAALKGKDSYCGRTDFCCTGAWHRLLAFHQILALAVSLADKRPCLDNNWWCDRNVVGKCECAIKLSCRASALIGSSHPRRRAADLRPRTATSGGIDQKPRS